VTWSARRPEPYTEIGIRRLKCIRCGAPARFQWQICSDGNNYRPLCADCDIALNQLVLDWMRHPKAAALGTRYALAKRAASEQ
jgi:hypothetical protein